LACVCVLHTFVYVVRIGPMQRSPLFPYTTLFRSQGEARAGGDEILETVAGGGLQSVFGQIFGHGLAPARRFGQQQYATAGLRPRSEEHTSELQSRENLVCRLLLEKKKKTT